ncbi:START domain-containing protein [Dyadobacter crusticola]|uniref:START domain-containing protein n=1 Tax=Dyadobacter crusticola TaxID=292407 RepID=UPI0004E13ADF|nr:START domain-containing protein [Dyadobacter crusticola]
MKNLVYPLTLFAFIFWLIQPASAEESWKFVTEKDGIKVYSKEVAGSRIKALQVHCRINAPIAEIVSLLMDVDAATDWVSHTKSCKLVRRVSPSELYYYSEISLPWPLENRDFVARISVSQNPATGIVTVDAPAVSGFVPIKKGIVRISKSTGVWVLTPVSTGQTQVQYTLQLDPGGAIPAWLVNSLSAQGPIDSFMNMKKRLAKSAPAKTS